MGRQLKWYSFRWRVFLLVLLFIGLSAGYVGWRLYNAVRVRPMGEGPAGPAIAAESFTLPWSDQPVVFLGLGDSVTRGLGAAKEHTYFELLIKNDDAMYPDMQGRDLSAVFASMTCRNYAQDYTTTQDHLDAQLIRIPQHDPDVRGIIVITSGGNDLLHDYGRKLPQDGAMYGCTYAQAQPWCENLKQRLDTLLTGLMAKFPGGCDIFLANIYDPTDGVGDPYTVGLPRWPAAMKVLDLANQKIAELCEKYPNVHRVDIHSAFLGHGIHCDEWWRSTYRKDDPHYWYYSNLEDPNRRGFDAIRRLFLQEMIRVFSREITTVQ
ncbi:MAG TPA: SGNH/GDSL hydrolase family protein [Anaerohalosphaeraceae bacterium]|nr:SGNH/GDSL hydrolase family protein [Anaerohalosphaeraceae bacterium]